MGALEGYPFTVTNNFLVPEYKIDFGTYAIPEEEGAKDIYARIMYLNKPENQSCASVARFYQIDGYYIYLHLCGMIVFTYVDIVRKQRNQKYLQF